MRSFHEQNQTGRNRRFRFPQHGFVSARLTPQNGALDCRTPPAAIVSVSTSAQKAKKFSANSARIPDRVLVSTGAANQER